MYSDSLLQASQTQTDRQTDRQVNRQTERQTERQTDRHADRQTDRQTATTDRKLHTSARVQGKKEYMPAALSRYDTALSADSTGCTMRALMTAKKSTLAYRAPSTFSRPPCDVTLSLQHQRAPSDKQEESSQRCHA